MAITPKVYSRVYFLRPLKCVLFVFSLSLFSFVNGRLTFTPVHTEAVLGNIVQLNCSTSEPYNVQWQHFPWGATQKQYVYFAGELVLPYSQRFEMDRDNATGRYNLIIPSVQKQDAGRYKCMDKGGSGEQAEAELIVLDSRPSCEVGNVSLCKEDSTVAEALCSVGFVGNIGPEVNCLGSGISDSKRTTMETLHNRRVYRFQMTVHWTRENSNSLAMHCHTVISHISVPVSAHISYAFNTPETQPMSHLESANCIANSSQPCSCQWIHNTTGEVSITPESPGRYTCIAKCLLRNSAMCEVQAELLIASEGTSVSNNRLIIIIVAILVVVLCLSILVLLILIKKKTTRNGERRTRAGKSLNRQNVDQTSQSRTSQYTASQSTVQSSRTYWEDDLTLIQPSNL